MKKWIRILVPLCAVVVLIVACVNLGGIFVEYSKGAAEYKELQEYVNTDCLLYTSGRRYRAGDHGFTGRKQGAHSAQGCFPPPCLKPHRRPCAVWALRFRSSGRPKEIHEAEDNDGKKELYLRGGSGLCPADPQIYEEKYT